MLAVELHDSTATGSIKLMIVLRYSSRFRSTASWRPGPVRRLGRGRLESGLPGGRV